MSPLELKFRTNFEASRHKMKRSVAIKNIKFGKPTSKHTLTAT